MTHARGILYADRYTWNLRNYLFWVIAEETYYLTGQKMLYSEGWKPVAVVEEKEIL